VLHWGTAPVVSTDDWSLDITGLVERPISLSWNEFQKLPRVKVYADFHCVTRWSRLDNVWEGVSVKTLLDMAGVKKHAEYGIAHGYDGGWTTNMPMNEFYVDDALVADLHDGEPLSVDHGAPARLIVPRLYAWKSAKWLKRIDLSPIDQPGFWERGGYHNYGDPWKEQRFGY
jgi:DMSO/TMAO reductase YedYZ molybdopterin-dependent catalytic subunit